MLRVIHPDILVPMRQIAGHPSAGEPPATVYDASGPYTDPAVQTDIARGLVSVRGTWIAARSDCAAYAARSVQPADNGFATGVRLVPTSPAQRTPLRARDGTSAQILPNTAGCHSAREAITTVQMANEGFGTNWIKLKVIGNADRLQPDPFALVEAARILSADGFAVFPNTTEDLIVANRLLGAGCRVLMPWAAPIGSGRGLRHVETLAAMRRHFPGVPLIVDAGIGALSRAAQAKEMGFDAALSNTAVARAGDPVAMPRAFGQAVAAGRQIFLPWGARGFAQRRPCERRRSGRLAVAP